jgi:hypothetical protein
MPGSFRRPPVAANEFLYALAVDGSIVRLSSRSGAKAKTFAGFEAPSAAFNRIAAVDVAGQAVAQGAAQGEAGGGAVRGWTLLAASYAAIEAVSLNDGKTHKLHEARVGSEVVANTSEAESTGFKGLAATGDFCAFAVRASVSEVTLTIRYFSENHPVEHPFTLDGTGSGAKVAGPVCHGDQTAMCSEHEVGVYDAATQTAVTLPMPRGFTPLLSRSSRELNVPPGSIPITVISSQFGRQVYLGGHLHGNPGLMRISLDGNSGDSRAESTEFRRLPAGSSITSQADGSLCVSTLDGIDCIGGPGPAVRTGTLEPGMPVSYDASNLCYFGEEFETGQHRIGATMGGKMREYRFDDPLCNRNTCCGAFFSGRDGLVAYLDVTAKDGNGLRFAHWSLAE